MENRRSLSWASILARLLKNQTVFVNEKKSGVLRSTFNRWKKQDLSRTEINLVRQKVGPDEFKLSLITGKADAIRFARKEQKRTAKDRIVADERRDEKERNLAKRVNTAINRIPFKAWNMFFHSMKEIDGFQIAPNKVQEVINAFDWWTHHSIETKDFMLIKQMTTPDDFVRFYIAGVE